ncbi:hypothetical protein DXT99_03960 [Pontibacter diazotrophicus]|uniref:Uncharacterized protein n=2 Tax=Pontibacter diazotrophicus TaxID=1400979 RepID=A0A3D8LG33_9BACT|nr:hypothetical protein DXT99_03960 [Pontibacter diazotrophicus]
MELDDLKAKWQSETTNHSHLNQKSMAQIQDILNGKTTDLITSMKRKYEKIISIMLGGMLLMVLVHPILTDGFTYPGSINGYVKLMFFYLVLIIFYWQKLKNINHLQLSDHLKERMEQLLVMLQRNYKTEVTFVVLFFFSMIIIGRFFYGRGLQDLDDTGVLIGFPLSILFTGAVIYFIVRRYKHQIKELKEYLAEYEEAA